MPRLKEYKQPQEHLKSKTFCPKRAVIPLSQHTGSVPELRVQKGDEVKVGQLLAEAQSLISAHVHSSVTGKVVDIVDYNHPVLKPEEIKASIASPIGIPPIRKLAKGEKRLLLYSMI